MGREHAVRLPRRSSSHGRLPSIGAAVCLLHRTSAQGQACAHSSCAPMRRCADAHLRPHSTLTTALGPTRTGLATGYCPILISYAGFASLRNYIMQVRFELLLTSDRLTYAFERLRACACATTPTRTSASMREVQCCSACTLRGLVFVHVCCADPVCYKQCQVSDGEVAIRHLKCLQLPALLHQQRT